MQASIKHQRLDTATRQAVAVSWRFILAVAGCDGGGKKAVKTFTASFFRCDDPDDLA